MIKVLLVCGGGASTGFLAQSMRKVAKSMNKEMDVIARSETEIDAYKNDYDVLLVGPHLKYLLDEIKEKVEGSDIKVGLIEQSVYATLDGEGALKQVFNILEGE